MPSKREPRERHASPRNDERLREEDRTRNGPGPSAEDKEYGEGNYKAARQFDEAEDAFVKSGKVEEAAREAAPKSEAEKQEMLAAEDKARRRAKGEDPALLKKKK